MSKFKSFSCVLILTVCLALVGCSSSSKADEIYNTALTEGKEGKWNDCINTLTTLKGKDFDADRVKILLAYANAQGEFARGSEEGYQKATKLLSQIPDDYEWDFKEPLKTFKQESRRLYEEKKNAREAAEAEAARLKAEAEEAERRRKEEARRPPLEITSVYMSRNSIDTPVINLSVRNVKNKTIDAFEVTVIAFDGYDRQLSQFGFGDKQFRGIAQNIYIVPKDWSNIAWTLNGFENGVKFKISLYSAHFTDGTVWEAEADQDISGIARLY